MARKKTVTAPSKFNIREADKLLTKLDVNKIKQLFSKLYPGTQVVQIGPTTVKLNCIAGPVTGHIDNNPSMYLDTHKGYVKCKACGYYSRNLLQVVKDSKGFSYRDALNELTNVVGVKVLSDKTSKELEAYDIHLTALQAVYYACTTYATKLIAPPKGGPDAVHYDDLALHAAAPTLKWLFHKRAHKPEYIGQIPYGVFPPRHLLSIYADEYLNTTADAEYKRFNTTHLSKEKREAVLDYLEKLLEGVTIDWVNAVAFFNGHNTRTLAKIRLRRPHNDDLKDGNYLTLKGFTEDEPLGYFGLYAPRLTSLSPSESKGLRVFLVEGENDAISAQERLLEVGDSGNLFIASNGSHNDLDDLYQAGIETINIVSDHPSEAIGRGETWLRGRLLTGVEINSRIFVGWKGFDAVIEGVAKDPDDVIRLGGFDVFKRVVVDDVDKTFVNVDTWAYHRALEDASDINPEDVRERTAVAVRFGECVRNAAQQAQYIERVSVALGLTPAVVRSLVLRSKDDEHGFIERTIDTIKRQFHILYKEDTQKGGVLYLHHRASDRTVRFAVDDGDAASTAFANVVGDIYQFYSAQVGIPAWILPDENVVQPVKDLQKTLSSYLRIALQTVYRGVLARNECAILGQGTHRIETPDVPAGYIFYVINGPHAYKGVPDPSEERVDWVKLDGPSEGRYIFTLEANFISPDAKSVEDLMEGNTYTLEDLKECINELGETIENAWTTLSTPLDAKYVAYSLAAYSSPHFCPSTTHVEIVGQHSSGKSTLLSLYCGGQYPHLQICGWAKGMVNYSPASIYQGFNYSTVAMCLDEHTRDLSMHTQKSIQVQNVNELLRQVIFPGGATITRGQQDGTTRVMRVRTNVVTSSIFPAHDAQDVSRRLTIETVKVEGKKDPNAVMLERLGQKKIDRIRRVFTLSTFKYYKRYFEVYKEVEDELAASKINFGFPVDTRFLRNFYSVGALMSLFGEDWRAFVKQFVDSRKLRLIASSKNTLAAQLFDTLFRTNSVKVGTGTISVAALLSNRESKALALNTSMSGVYYHEDKELLIVDWTGALSVNGVLFRNEAYGKSTPALLKYQLDQHTNSLRSHELEGLVPELAGWLQSFSVYTNGNDLSVLKMTKIIGDLREKHQEISRDFSPRPAANDGPPGLGGNRSNINNI